MPRFTYGICKVAKYVKCSKDTEVRSKFHRSSVDDNNGIGDVVLALDVRASFCTPTTKCLTLLQTHPHKKIIASASMEKDLTIRLWYDDE
jgi:hypothetical protein